MTNHEHVSVPVEPTEEMIAAGKTAYVMSAASKRIPAMKQSPNPVHVDVYKAMIAAAPRPGDGLERELATEYAIVAIESDSWQVVIDGVAWREFTEPDWKEILHRELEYLDQRGMLVYHPDREGVVRIKE